MLWIFTAFTVFFVFFTGSANIQKGLVGLKNPVNLTNDHDNNVHASDWKIASNCIDRLNYLGSKQYDDSKPWFMYCSINIPHPPFQTNATWLESVDANDIPIPEWIPEAEFHPADKYMSIAKHVWGNFTRDQINNVRKTC